MSTVLTVALAIYVIAFASAGWRVWARLGCNPELEDRFYQNLAVAGYALFAVSDSLNGMVRFEVCRFPCPSLTLRSSVSRWSGGRCLC